MLNLDMNLTKWYWFRICYTQVKWSNRNRLGLLVGYLIWCSGGRSCRICSVQVQDPGKPWADLICWYFWVHYLLLTLGSNSAFALPVTTEVYGLRDPCHHGSIHAPGQPRRCTESFSSYWDVRRMKTMRGNRDMIQLISTQVTCA